MWISTLLCGRGIAGIPSHSLCIRSSRCRGLMALQELCLPPPGADDAPGRILTHKHFQASLQPWECGNLWPAGACRKLNSCPSHAVLHRTWKPHWLGVKKLSQPLPPFLWTLPKIPPDCFLLISFIVFHLCYPASSKLS